MEYVSKELSLEISGFRERITCVEPFEQVTSEGKAVERSENNIK